jgi:predicted permease
LLFTKNLLQPALALGTCLLFHLSLDLTRSVVLLCAIPCGFFGLVFGKNFNCTPPDASSSLVSSYVFGIFTLAGWILLLNHLH